ncbi:MAG: tetratricopeptide repeat protein [Bacteroidales bacterium]
MKKTICFWIFILFTSALSAQTDTLKTTFDLKAAETSNYLNALKFLLNGDTENAKFILLDILSANPTNDAAAFELARIYFMEGNYTEAVQYASKAIESNPSNFYYHKLLLDIYQSVVEPEKETAVIKEIVQRWPDKISILHQYKKALLDSKRFKEALNVIDILIEKDNTDEDLYLEKFNVLKYLGNKKEAEKSLANFISRYPCNQKASLFLSNFYFEQKDDKKGIKALEGILNCDSLNDIANLTLAEYYHKKGKRQLTYLYLRKAFANPAVSVSSKMNYIVNLYPVDNMKSDPLLESQLKNLVEIVANTHPGDPDAQRIGGDVFFIDKVYDKAATFYERLLKLGNYPYQSVENLMFCYINLNYNEALNRIARKAADEFPYQPLPHYFCGMSYFADSNYSSAIAELEKAAQYGSNIPELQKPVYTALGDLYGYLKDYDQSYMYYEKVLSIDSLNALVLNNYAYSLAERKINLDKALKMSEMSLKIDSVQSSYLDTYGWVLFRLGRYQEALNYIKKALQHRESPDPVLLEHLGDVLYHLGRKQDAWDYWKEAAQLGKGTHFLLRKVETGEYYEE